ncbi:MAG: NAD-dependent epimerase/dehydratase family protein [Spirochaetaceae bacterium]|jgi:nucleoside-diphosphate-sugar epimerase|nr:NAD-dependent epimerase/dehydratase family protein [Spirochaetaceae bacterium]
MKVLFIGGTGTISAAISRRAVKLGWDLWLLNRGNRSLESWHAPSGPGTVHPISCDISDEEEAKKKLAPLNFDAAADFIAYTPEQVQRDYRLLKGKTGQYFFISSASAYQKPLSSCYVTEGTPLANPYWEYSRQKIACEDLLWKLYRDEGFPITIVRPSHTYDERSVPLGVHGKHGSWQVIRRILDGKPVIIHGDGTSLWTMTHNSDFARAFTDLVGNIRALGEAVQITSGETLCWNQIYQAIANALGKPLKAVHVSSEFLALAGPGYDFLGGLTGDKAVSVLFDNSKLKGLAPRFYPRIRFDQGIRDTLGHILTHPELQVPDPDFDAFCDRVIAIRERALKELTG